MDNMQIILSKISEIMSRRYFIVRNNPEFKARLKCAELVLLAFFRNIKVLKALQSGCVGL